MSFAFSGECGLEFKICNYVLIIKLHFSRFSHSRLVESRDELKRRDAAHKGPVGTSATGNVDHIHAVEQAVEVEEISDDVSSSSPDKIHHETNPAVNPIHDKPASRLYPSLPGEKSGGALGKKTNDTKPSKSELSDNPVKSQQVFHVNEALQESDVTDNGNQDNGSNSSPNNVAGQSSADTYNEEHESQTKTEHSVDYLKRSKAIQLQVVT